MKTGLTNWTMTDEQKDAVSGVWLFSKTQSDLVVKDAAQLQFVGH